MLNQIGQFIGMARQILENLYLQELTFIRLKLMTIQKPGSADSEVVTISESEGIFKVMIVSVEKGKKACSHPKSLNWLAKC